MADLERNKAVTRVFYEDVWSGRRLDRIDEIATEDIVLHVWETEKRGRDGLHEAVEGVWLPAFPDLSAQVHLQLAEGDLVADHVTFRGTHSGAPFHGIEASGAPFSFTQTTICRIEDGGIAEIWEDFDWAGLLRSLGAS